MSVENALTYRGVVSHGLNGFQALKPAWDSIVNGSDSHYVHSFDWPFSKLSCMDSKPEDFMAVSIYRGEVPVAIVPLSLTKKTKRFGPFSFSVRILTLYSPDEMGVSDIVLRPREVNSLIFRALIQALKGMHWHLLCFKNVPESSYCRDFLESCGHTYSKKYSHPSKYIDTQQSFDALISDLKKKFVRNVRRKYRRLEERGEISFKTYQDEAGAGIGLQHFLDVESSGWKGVKGHGIQQRPDALSMYQYLTTCWSSEQKLRINIMFLDNIAVAAQFSVVAGSTWYLLKIGYDEAYKESSPGSLLLQEILRRACEDKNTSRVSFVTSVSWANEWKPKSENVNVAYIAKNPILNRLLRYVYK